MSEHPGQKLKMLRESKGITLEQAARETCIRAGMLTALEEAADDELLPSVYRKLSLRMYARYLGIDCEMTRTAAPAAPPKTKRITPMGVYLRRMGRAVNTPSSLDPTRRNRLLTVVKTASVAVVVVVAAGLWSLNAKISRLHLDDTLPEPAAVLVSPPPAEAPPARRAAPEPAKISCSLNLDDPISFTFDVPIHWLGCNTAE